MKQSKFKFETRTITGLTLLVMVFTLMFHTDAFAADVLFHAPPTLDGQISPDEYVGVGNAVFPGLGGNVTVYFSEDADNLYVAFDFGSVQTPGSAAQIFVDTNNDKSAAPQTDDYRFSITQAGDEQENKGDGEFWVPVLPDSWKAAVSTNVAGWQAEFAISYEKLGLVAGTPKTMGLALANAWTPTDYWWPGSAFWTNPSTWGQLGSSSNWGDLIFDLDEDGDVDVVDIMKVAGQWGWTGGWTK